MNRRSIVLILLVAAAAVAGCGGSDEQALSLSPGAAAGKQVAERSCGGCHTTNGRSSSGPTWQGLAGSQVQLTDGSTVTADDAYLTRAIANPSAEIVKGFNDTMGYAFPPGSISAEDTAHLVAYIKALSAPQ